MICADKNKKQFCRSLYIYRLQATQCNTEQLLKRFFDFLNVKIRVGKGEDTRTTSRTSPRLHQPPLSCCCWPQQHCSWRLIKTQIGPILRGY